MNRYVASEHRKETAKKRLPIYGLVQLNPTILPELPTTRLESTPEQIFHYAWAVDLLEEVLSTAKKECYDTGKAVHWDIFHAKLVVPILENSESPPLKDLCKKYGVENEAKASNMIITVKRRFTAVLNRFLRQYLQSDSEVEDEFNDLLEILSKGSAG